jgi:hypothetical protein
MYLELADRGANDFGDVINLGLVKTISTATPEIVAFINVATDATPPTSNDTVLFYALNSTNTIIAVGNGRGSYPQYSLQTQANTVRLNGQHWAWYNNQWTLWTYLTKDDEAIFYSRQIPVITNYLTAWDNSFLNTNPDFIFYASQSLNTIWVTFDNKMIEVDNVTWCRYQSRLQFYSADILQWIDADDSFSNIARLFAYSIPTIQNYLPTWNDTYLNPSPTYLFYANSTTNTIYLTFSNRVMTIDGVSWCRYQSRLQVYSKDYQQWQDADKFFTDTRLATITNLCRNTPEIVQFVPSSFLPPQSNDVQFYAIAGTSKIIASQLGNNITIDNCYSCRFNGTHYIYSDNINAWTGADDEVYFNNSGDTGGNGSIDLPLTVFKDINTTGDNEISMQFTYHFTQRSSVSSNRNTPNLIYDFSNMPEVASVNYSTIEEELYSNTTGTLAQYNYAVVTTINANTGTISLANDADGLNYSYHKFNSLTWLKLLDTNGNLIRKYYLDLNALINQGVGSTNYDTEISGQAIIRRVF